jgi:hypothetical protein
MKDLIKYYGDALAKIAIGGFLIGIGSAIGTDGVMIYGAKKFMLNAATLDENAVQTFMNTIAEKIGK